MERPYRLRVTKLPRGAVRMVVLSPGAVCPALGTASRWQSEQGWKVRSAEGRALGWTPNLRGAAVMLVLASR